MNTDTLEYPPRMAPDAASRAVMAQANPPAATLKDTALASFVPIEAHMRTLAARYANVAYDVTTPKGMKDAKAARLVLRDEGRYAVQRLQKRLKDEANDLKRTLDSKADELIAITMPVEAAIDGQIAAEETRREAEREEKARIERERVSALEAKLADLSVWIERCKAPGMTSERIALGIDALKAAEFVAADWAEFLPRALARKAEVLEVMSDMGHAALAREMEAARLDAQRLENERIAAEQRAEAERLAEQQRLLAEQAAELQRKAEALAEQERAAAQALIDNAAEAERLAEQRRAELATELVDELIAASAAPIGVPIAAEHLPALQQLSDWAERNYDAADYIPPAVTDGEPQPQTEAEIKAANGPEVDPLPEPATLKLGTISARLGFAVTAAFLQSLDLTPAGRDKNAVLYRESQWPEITAALIRHIKHVEATT